MATSPHHWQNWAGNQRARPRKTASPASAEEVAAAVKDAGRDGLTVRMAGTGHSFTPAAVTDGLLLRPDGLRAVRSVDARAGLVTVEAGCPLRNLNETLLRHGLSLANMGDIQEQTVAAPSRPGPTAPCAPARRSVTPICSAPRLWASGRSAWRPR